MSSPVARQQGSPVARDAQPLLARYRSVRGETERLAEPLTAEDQCVQSMPDASPTKWHRAHTTWFFETFLLAATPGYRKFDERFGFLFNSYYDAVGARHARPMRGLLTRPGADDVRAYRQHVDAEMEALLATRGDEADFAALVELGLHHEQQHQELMLTDILHAFAQNPLAPAYVPYVPAFARGAPNDALTEYEGGIVVIGHDGNGFAFDNETPPHETLVHPFSLSNGLVTNGEWLEFIAAGGYGTPAHWLSDGWQIARADGWQAPLYWQQRDNEWYCMTLSGLRPVEPGAPVAHVSFYEADAFARWRGKRLPTEQEWETAARAHGEPSRHSNFRESGYLRPLPGASGLFGDVWQWTQSPYVPYPGYRPAEGAVGEYNGKFMVNQMVLRGGSCVTNAGHIRASYRNFFYPHQRWQFTGLRLAEDRPRRRLYALRNLPPFLEDVWKGLSASQKGLPSKYFYDTEGSRLFEAICELPEYYLTRSEGVLLRSVSRSLAESLAPDTTLIEFGCGACTKTRLLLDRLPVITRYVPIDICEDALRRSTEPLREDYPDLVITPLAGDFNSPIALPADVLQRPRLGFFSGSTIGNFDREEALFFLRTVREGLGPEAQFLVAIDLVKDTAALLLAYDDAQGVTAQFNRNLLVRINRELGGNFDLEAFAHAAVWNARENRIEMHLLSQKEQTVWVAGRPFSFARGETIHTENSHKYTVEGFAALANEAGWSMLRSWQSPAPEFALVLLG